MFWNRRTDADAPEATDAPGISDNVRALLASAAGYFRARAELAGIEGKEAVSLYGKIIALVAGAILLLLFGYILFVVGVVAVISLLAGIHWGWIALIAAALHFFGTVICLTLASQRWGQPVFSATLDEFRKDQQWLNSRPSTARANS